MLPFNLESYTDLLRNAIKVGYRFIGFDELEPTRPPHVDSCKLVETSSHLDDNSTLSRGGQCLLRHDVDVDLAAAAAMAATEYQLGIRATYFLMWRSPCYNLMSRSGQTFAESILEMGHHIGLHYDQGFDAQREIAAADTARQVKQQAEWLQALLGTVVHAVSFHQPSSAILQSGVDCGDRINTYDRIRLQYFRYFSDSNRIFPLWQSNPSQWHEGDITKALAECYPQNIQLLIHPMWWAYNDNSTEAVWNRALMSNFEQMQAQLLETERAFGSQRRICIT